MTDAMSPSQKDDDGQEWEEREWDVLWKGNYILSNASPLAREWIVTLGNEKAALEERVRVLEEALRVRGKCFHCQGTGKPNCVTCDDYQACRCRPGEGRYAEHCWNCKGTGLNAWAAALLSPAAATEGGEGA